jgi:hypothetical protein
MKRAASPACAAGEPLIARGRRKAEDRALGNADDDWRGRCAVQRPVAVKVLRADQPRRGPPELFVLQRPAGQHERKAEGPRCLSVDPGRTSPIQRTREVQGVDGISFTVHPGR